MESDIHQVTRIDCAAASKVPFAPHSKRLLPMKSEGIQILPIYDTVQVLIGAEKRFREPVWRGRQCQPFVAIVTIDHRVHV